MKTTVNPYDLPHVYLIRFSYMGQKYFKAGKAEGGLGRSSAIIKDLEKCPGVHSVEAPDFYPVKGSCLNVEQAVFGDPLISPFRVKNLVAASTEVFLASCEKTFVEVLKVKVLQVENIAPGVKAPVAGRQAMDVIGLLAARLPENGTVLDLCAGDGRLSNALANKAREIRLVEIDKFNLPTTTKINAVAKVIDVFDLPDGQWKSDLVIINPPFSDPEAIKNSKGFPGGGGYYWKFITKAKKHLNPGGQLVFIAPNSWESCLGSSSKDGRYEVLEYNASFGKHPPATVVVWTAGSFEVVNGRDSRKPEMPEFNVEVLKVGENREGWEAGLKQTYRVIKEGEKPTGRDILLKGPDAKKLVDWVVSNKEAVAHWWGSSASGMDQIKTGAIRELLRK